MAGADPVPWIGSLGGSEVEEVVVIAQKEGEPAKGGDSQLSKVLSPVELPSERHEEKKTNRKRERARACLGVMSVQNSISCLYITDVIDRCSRVCLLW